MLAAISVPVACAGRHLAMIRFGATGDGGQQVVADGTHVQFVHLSARGGGDQADQLIIGQADFLPGVEVVVVHGRLDPGFLFSFSLIEQIVSGDHLVVDRVAQVRQIDAAERSVPVGAIALRAIEGASGPVELLAVDSLPLRPTPDGG